MHSSSSSNSQQPWHFDENIYPDIIAAEQNVQGDRPYRLVEGGKLDYKRVWKLYDESPPPGYTIGLVEVIYDQRIQERFEVELGFLEQRASKSAAGPFQATWVKECSSPEEKKTRQYVLNHLTNRSQTPLGFRHIKVVPMFHATKQAVLESIFRVGFTVLARKEGDINDPGYFGKGIYLTSSAKYSYSVYGSDNILLFNWASYFAAYPVVHKNGEWIDKLGGKEHYKNYDAHYVLVNPLDPNNPNENSYFPISDIEKHTYDELVIFNSNQMLPRYIVHLEPNGLNLKQVSTKTDSIFDSILGLLFTKIELTVGTLLQEIDNYLKSTKRIELEKLLSVSTKQSLENELKLKSDALSTKDLKKNLAHEEAWILRQLLCIQKNKNEKIAKILLHALCARLIPQDAKTTFVGSLCAYYKSKNSIPRLFKPPLHIEQNYIQLVLVEGEKENKDQQEKISDETREIYKEQRLGSWEDIQLSKKTIQLESLFDAKKEGEEAPKHIAILGRAGIGKSTLCQYICYQWANGNLWNDKFEALIWIPLRQLVNAKDDDSIYDLVRQHCILPSGRTELRGDQIKEYLFKNEEKVLFVLDGYDEIASSLQEESFTLGLMQEFLLQKKWILASRPYACHGLRVDRTLENVGFSNLDIREYVNKSLPSQEGKLLLSEIQNQSWLSGIAHVPLNLELICSTWEEKIAFSSMSNLYTKFTLELLRRFLKRRGITSAHTWEEKDFTKKFPSSLSFLEHLAWQGLQKKNLVLSLRDKDLRAVFLYYLPEDPDSRPEFEKILLELGFLRSSGSGIRFEENEYEFSHLTFQEFFAARYICGLLQKDLAQAEELIVLHKFNPQLQMVWYFVSGLLKDQSTLLNKFFDLYDQAPDLVGLYGFQYKSRCLEECGSPKHLTENPIYTQQANFWIQWLSGYYSVEVLRNLFHSSAYRTILGTNSELVDAGSHIGNLLLPSFFSMIDSSSSLTRQQALYTIGELLQVKEIGLTRIIPKLCSLILNNNEEVALDAQKFIVQAKKIDSTYEQLAVQEATKMMKVAHHSKAHKVLGIIADSLTNENIDSFLRVAQDVLKKTEVPKNTLYILLRVFIKFPAYGDKIVPILLDSQYYTDAYVWREIASDLRDQLSTTSYLSKSISLPFLNACRDKNLLIRVESLKMLVTIAKDCPDLISQIVSELRNSLTDSSGSIRETVARSCGMIFEYYPDETSNFAPALMRSLYDNDKDVCLAAAQTLFGLIDQNLRKIDSQKIHRMLDIIEEQLNKDYPNHRDEILSILAKNIKSQSSKILPILKNTLNHKSNYVREACLTAIINTVKSTPSNASFLIPLLAKKLESSAGNMRYAIARFLLSWLEYCPNHISEIFDILTDPFTAVSRNSSSSDQSLDLEALSKSLLVAPQYMLRIIPRMLYLGSEENIKLISTLMRVFKVIPSRQNEIMQAIVKEFSFGYEHLYNYENSKVSEKWMRIKIFAEDISETLDITNLEPFIIFFQSSVSSDLRARTVFCLAKLLEADSRHSQKIVPILKIALQDRDRIVRLATARAISNSLIKWPELSEAIIAELSASLDNEDYGIRVDAICCLLNAYQSKSAYTQKIITALIRALRNGDKDTRFVAACVLASCLSDCLTFAEEVIMVLESALHNKEKRLHPEAISSLGIILKNFPQYANQIVPEFLHVLEEQNRELLRAASSYFIDVFKNSPQNQVIILDKLERFLKLKDDLVFFKVLIVKSMSEFLIATPSHRLRIISCFRSLLADEQNAIRTQAAKELGKALRLQPANPYDLVATLFDFVEKEKNLYDFEFEMIFEKYDCSSFPLTFNQLMLILIKGKATFLEATSFENLIKNASKNVAKRDQYLRVIIVKCLEEKIPIFLHNNAICFYKNGLQVVIVDQAQEIAERLSTLSRQFPLELLQYIVKYYSQGKKEVDFSQIAFLQSQIEAFKKLDQPI